MEYGGLKPILPFLGGRSDAARRVVIQSSRLPPMEPYGLYNDAAPNRDAVRCVATNAPPPYARIMPHMEIPVFTTTRHAASLRSSNNCKCLIETFFIARGESPLHKGLNPYGPFSAVSLLEHGGLKPILPFLEGRSDAACRVVIRLGRSRCCMRGVNGGRGGDA